MTPKRILILMAMEQEASGIIANLGLIPHIVCGKTGKLPFRYYSGKLNGVELVLSVSGKDHRYGMDNIGLESATLQSFCAISEFSPDLVINGGTCGSFASKGARVGDSFLSERHFVFHDHRIPLGKFEQMGKGEYKCADTHALASYLELKTGIVSSGSSLDYTDRDLEVFHSLGASLKEMEVGATAYVCELLHAPLFAVKTVTNVIDVNPDSAGEFAKNLEIAVASLTKDLKRVVEAVTEGRFPELLKLN